MKKTHIIPLFFIIHLIPITVKNILYRLKVMEIYKVYKVSKESFKPEKFY